MTHPKVTVPAHRARRGRQHPLVHPPVKRISRRRRRTPATAAQWRLPRFGICAVGRSRDRRPQAGHSPAATGDLRPAASGIRPAASGPRRKCRTFSDTRDGNVTPASLVTDVPAFRTSGIRAAPDSRCVQRPRHPMPGTSDARMKCRIPGDMRDGYITPATLVTDVPAFRTTGIRVASDSRCVRRSRHPMPDAGDIRRPRHPPPHEMQDI